MHMHKWSESPLIEKNQEYITQQINKMADKCGMDNVYSPSKIPELALLLEEPDDDVCVGAAQALLRMCPPLLPIIISAYKYKLSEFHPVCRHLAQHIEYGYSSPLSALFSDFRDYQHLVIEYLRGPHPEWPTFPLHMISDSLLEALNNIEKNYSEEKYLPIIPPPLKSPYPEYWAHIFSSSVQLLQLGEFIEWFIEYYMDGWLLWAFIWVVGEISEKDKENRNMHLYILKKYGTVLKKYVTDPNPRCSIPVGVTSLYWLGKNATSEEIPVLLQVLEDEQYGLARRATAAWALGQIGDPQVCSNLMSIAEAPVMDIILRNAASNAVREIGPRAIPTLLQTVVDIKKDPLVRKHAIKALGIIGVADAQVIKVLSKISRDWHEDLDVRYAALEAVKYLASKK